MQKTVYDETLELRVFIRLERGRIFRKRVETDRNVARALPLRALLVYI